LKPIITVVGSIHMDFYIHLPKLPKEDETVVGYEFKMYPGGKGANQAVAAARLGAKVFFIGRVGSDFLGPMLLENLRSNNVDVSYLTVGQSTHTGVAFILLNSRGENMIAVAPGTDSRVSPDDVDKALPAVKSSSSIATPTRNTYGDSCLCCEKSLGSRVHGCAKPCSSQAPSR
jgi:ribokinase